MGLIIANYCLLIAGTVWHILWEGKWTPWRAGVFTLPLCRSKVQARHFKGTECSHQITCIISDGQWQLARYFHWPLFFSMPTGRSWSPSNNTTQRLPQSADPRILFRRYWYHFYGMYVWCTNLASLWQTQCICRRSYLVFFQRWIQKIPMKYLL